VLKQNYSGLAGIIFTGIAIN